MEISLQMNSGIGKRFPRIHSFELKSISCRARTVALENGKTNFYEVLSLDSNNVGLDEIKKAYRCKALKFHPDACPPVTKEESTRRFIEIKMAYETLSDPISREMYDYELGLRDSWGRRYGSCCMEEKRAGVGFSREVWQRQLNGLKKRSSRRMEEKIHT